MKYPKWVFINSGASSPSFNMALDEALLNWHSEGLIPPVIRFYSWQPAALSIGYFQKVEKEIDMEAVNRLGLGFVRRPTGGRGFSMSMNLHIASSSVKIIRTCRKPLRKPIAY